MGSALAIIEMDMSLNPNAATKPLTPPASKRVNSHIQDPHCSILKWCKTTMSLQSVSQCVIILCDQLLMMQDNLNE